MAECALQRSNYSIDWTQVMPGRSLHYVFKVGDRKKTMDFYRNVLLMKVLRHEEFEEGCKATCNGPYNGRWSKTMVGYGSEDENFVIELTYNYEIGSYQLGNDYFGIFVDSDEVFEHVKKLGSYETRPCGRLQVTDPDGHRFMVWGGNGRKITRVATQVKDLDGSINYWKDMLGMALLEKNEEKKQAKLAYGAEQCQWEMRQIASGEIVRKTAFGRIAFAYPGNKLSELEMKIKKNNLTVLKELVTLETPGKAEVQVVILADPDGHEICFVGDEGFRQLSVVDTKAEELLDEAITKDDSASWFPNGKRQG